MSNGKGHFARKNFYEKAAWDENSFVCGIDEVGRGCLAGPLVTAAVILRCTNSRLIKDSKLLNPKQLATAAAWIARNGWWAYGIISPQLIDRYNIYQATLLAMQRAVITLLSQAPRPQLIVVDAMPLSLAETAYADLPIKAFPAAETYSCSVAAASIMAKVRRDKLMRQLGNTFPAYQLGKHKGYGTRPHQAALATHGASIIHRTSFLRKFTIGPNCEDADEQQSLC